MSDEVNADHGMPRSELVSRVLDDCITRRAAGELVPNQSLIDAHPSLLPELANELCRLSVIESGLNEAEVQSRDESRFRRCPDCGSSLALEALDSESTEATCPTCGGAFRVTDEQERISAGQLLGRFEILNKLGEGAFGSVWCARDSRLDRLVAVKVPHKGRLSIAEMDQFVHEARAAAQLRHRHIVRVHEVTQEGDIVFLVADYVQGHNLAEWIKVGQVTPREAAELCAKLADALDHAHASGVIHRDVKPSNIMVDYDGEPYLMDFGLAKLERGEVTMTADGKLLGTPAYMSPEQARGTAHDADRRSDVYSLGVVLYELVTGERPFRGSTRMLLHQILFEDAPRVRHLNAGVPKDLETICLKCLEKDPDRRYRTARELAEDLRRFILGESVRARPITRAARTWRWGKRNPLLSGLAAALILAVAAGFIGVTSMGMRARQARDAHQQLAFDLALDRGLRLCEEGNVGPGMLWLARGLELVPRASAEVEKTVRINIAYWRPRLVSLQGFLPDDEKVSSMAFSPDGKMFLIGTSEGYAVLRDIQSGRIIRKVRAGSGRVSRVAVCHEYLLTYCDGDDTVRLWDLESGQQIGGPFPQQADVVAAAISPDGSTFVVGSEAGIARIWTSETGKYVDLERSHDGRVVVVACSPDGNLVLTAHEGGHARVWDAKTGNPVSQPPAQHGDVWALAFSHDGSRFASAGDSGVVSIADTGTGELLLELPHSGRIRNLAFSPNGHEIMAQCQGDVWVWNLPTKQVTYRILLDCNIVAFSPDGTTFVADSSAHRAARIWNLPGPEVNEVVFDHQGRVLGVDVSPDGSTMVTSGPNGLRLWDIASRRQLKSEAGRFARIAYVGTDPARVAVSYNRTQVRLWNLDTMKPTGPPMVHDDWINSVATNQDGSIVLTACFDNFARLWAADTCQLVVKIPHPDIVLAAAFVPDGMTFVTACEDGTAQFWDSNTHQPVGIPMNHAAGLLDIAVSPNGQLVATACADGTAQLWDVATQARFGKPLRHEGRVRSIAFSPDGDFVVTGCEDGTVRAWHVATGRPIVLPRRHSGKIYDVLFTPSGDHIISGGTDDRTARLWTAPPRPMRGDVKRITVWTEFITGLKLDQDNTIRVLDETSWRERQAVLKELGGPPIP